MEEKKMWEIFPTLLFEEHTTLNSSFDTVVIFCERNKQAMTELEHESVLSWLHSVGFGPFPLAGEYA
jgi:hypothetical protein